MCACARVRARVCVRARAYLFLFYLDTWTPTLNPTELLANRCPEPSWTRWTRGHGPRTPSRLGSKTPGESVSLCVFDTRCNGADTYKCL